MCFCSHDELMYWLALFSAIFYVLVFESTLLMRHAIAYNFNTFLNFAPFTLQA